MLIDEKRLIANMLEVFVLMYAFLFGATVVSLAIANYSAAIILFISCIVSYLIALNLSNELD